MIGLFVGISLSLDAFTVSVLKGFLKNKINLKFIITIAFYFGLFQGIMPMLGYFIGKSMYDVISLYDHYIILILFSILGLNMIISTKKEDISVKSESINFKEMILLSIATSIDAFTVGITFTFLTNNIFLLSFEIALVTFIICFLGVLIGHKAGTYFSSKVNLIGGITLIILGIKIFLEHLL